MNRLQLTDMKLFSNTCVKRNTAFMVLLMWLFALASGVANACLLEERQTHSHIPTVVSPEAAQAFVIFPAHAGAVADGGDASHFKGPCLKVCDDGSSSFTKQDSTVVQIDPGPALLVLVLWGTIASVIPTLHQTDHEKPVTPDLPIRVRFSRLAI